MTEFDLYIDIALYMFYAKILFFSKFDVRRV